MIRSSFTYLILILVAALSITACSTFKDNMQRGDVAFERGNYQSALQAYDAALKDEPRSGIALERREAARDRLFGQRARDAFDTLAKGQHRDALHLANQAAALYPGEARSRELLSTVAVGVRADAEDAFARVDYAEALSTYRTLKAYQPSAFADLNPRIESIASRWSGDLADAARDAEEREHFGRALLYWAKASQLQPERRDLMRAEERTRQTLLERYGYEVALTGSERNPVFLDIARELEQTRWHAGMSVSTSRHADARLDIQLSPLTLDTFTHTDYERVTVQEGTRLIDNPAWVDAHEHMLSIKRDLDDLDREREALTSIIDTYTRNLDSKDTTSEAARRLQRARQERDVLDTRITATRRDYVRCVRDRDALARHIEEPVFADYEVPVYNHELIASLTLDAALEHRGANIGALRQRFEEREADRYHDAFPELGMYEDPLVVPTRDALLSNLKGEAAERLRGQLHDGFQVWRDGFRDAALTAASDAEELDLLLINAALSPRDVPTSISGTISRLSGIPDALPVLGKRIHG